MKLLIPKPIIFNPYKHHYYFIKEQIGYYQSKNGKDYRQMLLKTGNNLLDLYYGKLPVTQICNQCIAYVAKNNVLEKQAFVTWINSIGYEKIQLSDKSHWIIKKAEDQENYIHIHPAKKSVYTRRVRATTLKTVIALKINSVNHPTLEMANTIRLDVLNLPPIKKLEQEKGILKLMRLFNRL